MVAVRVALGLSGTGQCDQRIRAVVGGEISPSERIVGQRNIIDDREVNGDVSNAIACELSGVVEASSLTVPPAEG